MFWGRGGISPAIGREGELWVVGDLIVSASLWLLRDAIRVAGVGSGCGDGYGGAVGKEEGW